LRSSFENVWETLGANPSQIRVTGGAEVMLPHWFPINALVVSSAIDEKPTDQDKSGIQIPNSLPGANRESSCRLSYVQY
jgi:hypothetical protein